MNNYLKNIALLLAMLLPIAVAAYDYEVDGIYYNINNALGTASVTYKTISYNSYSGNVTIPESITYNGGIFHVTHITGHAFQQCRNLTSITIPNSVTTIGEYAFSECTGLTSITIPNSVTTIGNSAFYLCSRLTDVVIPNSVTLIGTQAFSYCTELTTFDIPNSVTSIEGLTFAGCTKLANVTIPNTIISIGRCVFYDCTNLEKVNIPNSVTFIGGHTFHGCTKLSSINIPNSVISIEDGTFYGCTELVSVSLPKSLQCIEKSAFYDCFALTDITIPNSVYSIGDEAFLYCTKLQNVSLPNSLLYIGNSTFECCISLTSLFIPNSVVSIGNKAFCFCTSLKSVELPNSLTSIGNNVFEYCDKISSLSIVGKGDWIGGGIDCSTYNLFIDSSITSIKGIQIKPSNVYSFTSIPPICDENSFTDYTGTLHVPATSLATYFTTPYWCNFSNIIGNAAEPNIALNKDSINLNLNFQYHLIATVSPTNAYPNNVIWSTSDSTIATVNNGLITAVTVGECDIIAKCLFSEAICHVVVNNSEIAIYLDQHEALVLPNHIIVLDPTSSSDILPNLKVTSSNPSVAVARVINGKVQVVGIKEGTTTITVGSVDGTAIPATCLVTVYTEPGDLNCDGFLTISDVTSIIDYLLSDDTENIKVENADVNGDGNISISDVTTLIDILLSGE